MFSMGGASEGSDESVWRGVGMGRGADEKAKQVECYVYRDTSPYGVL